MVYFKVLFIPGVSLFRHNSPNTSFQENLDLLKYIAFIFRLNLLLRYNKYLTVL